MQPVFQGRFANGVTAAVVAVRIELEETGLRLEDEAGEAIVVWPYQGLALIEREHSKGPLALRHDDFANARLTLSFQADFLQQLVRQAPDFDTRPRLVGRNVLQGLALVAATVLFGLLAYYLVLGASGVVARFLPVSLEARIGVDVANSLGKHLAHVEGTTVRYCAADAGRAVLRDLTQRLAGENPKYDFDTRVIDLEMVNAFAAPGGPVIVTRGLIDFAASSDEFAAVLAHELAHISERHGTKAVIRHYGFSAIFDLFFPGQVEVGFMADAAELLLNMSHSRDAEWEADRIGSATLARVGTDQTAFARFFQRLRKKQGDFPEALSLIATHPRLSERADAAAKAGTGNQPAMSEEAWTDLREICARRSD